MEQGATTLWPFVARATELGQLVDGRSRGAVLVGEAGTGKSRLLAEAADRFEASGHRVVRIGGSPSLAPIPFGALAGVLDLDATTIAPLDAIQQALGALAGGSPLTEVVLAADDAHELDDASAGLLLLAARSGARILAAVRANTHCPAAVTDLWKDDLVDRLDLCPLDPSETAALLEAVLGGPLDSRSRHRLHDATRGNLLFLRELVRTSLRNGTLAERDGIWSWNASAIDVPSVRDLVRQRLEHVASGVDTVVELLAIGEPLGISVLESLAGAGAVAGAEREGLVVGRGRDRRREYLLAHPIYAEVVRESLGVARRGDRAATLTRALAAVGERRRGDRLRIAVLGLDAGVPADPRVLDEAAREAGVRADLPLAERLAREAVAVGGSTPSEIQLGDILYWAGRHAEVVDLLDRELPLGTPPECVARAALLVASSLYWGLGRFDDADAHLTLAVERVGPPWCLELLGQRSQMLMFAGRARESIAVGRHVLDDECADAAARLRAYAGVLPSAATCGRLDEADAEIPVAMDLALHAVGDLSLYATGGVMVAMFITRMFSGGLDQVDVLAGAMLADSLQRVDDPFRGVWSFLLGRSALAQGHLAQATAHLRDAVALLRGRDPGGMLPWALAALTETLGATADARGSQATLRELDRVRVPTMHNIDVDIELGRAWAAAAAGQPAEAQRTAAAIGRSLLDDGRLVLGVYALHDAVRLGARSASVADDLVAGAAACDGAVAAAMATHVRALKDDDLDGLVEASHDFERCGWILHAAEAAACSSRSATARGLNRRRQEGATRASSLASACGPALTPMLETPRTSHALSTLTRREQEVALMAARGMSKREIAEALFLSVRTVGNHINHIYGKLGISTRDELHAAVDPAGDAPT